MDAELSRLLARAIQSPYYRLYGSLLVLALGLELDSDETLQDYLINQAVEAGTLKKLPDELQEFLQTCDRSFDVEYELFDGKMVGTQAEMDAKVIAQMEEDGDIKVEKVEENAN